MTDKTETLAPYGDETLASSLAKAGGGKGGGKRVTPASLARRMPTADLAAKVGGPIKTASSQSLASRMPSADVAAKVGLKDIGPASLASRMPSPDVAAKVGLINTGQQQRLARVVRRSAKTN